MELYPKYTEPLMYLSDNFHEEHFDTYNPYAQYPDDPDAFGVVYELDMKLGESKQAPDGTLLSIYYYRIMYRDSVNGDYEVAKGVTSIILKDFLSLYPLCDDLISFQLISTLLRGDRTITVNLSEEQTRFLKKKFKHLHNWQLEIKQRLLDRKKQNKEREEDND